jgi:hypothetical protein
MFTGHTHTGPFFFLNKYLFPIDIFLNGFVEFEMNQKDGDGRSLS